MAKRPQRYCPMCEKWVGPRETECKACGMPTEKLPKEPVIKKGD